MNANEVLSRYLQCSVELSTSLLENDDEDPYPMILIEGKQNALRMLAELLLAVSDDRVCNSISISPNGAGSFHFKDTAKIGIYINRLLD
jgi:hypothetical protein